jgi:uncharacterized protein YgiM (DUF1202 family)
MMRRKILAVLFGVLFLGTVNPAKAAQVAEVIVPQANVYLYPQASSKVISKLGRGESLAVSNIATEGFYKVRLKNGDMGWVSGNDILSGGSSTSPGTNSADPNAVAPLEPRARKRTPQRRNRSNDEDYAGPSGDDSFRLLVGYGVQFASYAGLKDNFDGTSGLNPGKHFGIEAQFKMSHAVYWGIRLESMNASATTNLTTDISQTIQVKEIPVEIGIMWSPVSSHKFRFGLGAYLGAVASGNTSIAQTTTSSQQKKTVEYSTIELCGTLASQFSVGLGERIGLFLEADYRYDQTGKNPDTTIIKAVPGFKLDYSGVLVRAGLELRL